MTLQERTDYLSQIGVDPEPKLYDFSKSEQAIDLSSPHSILNFIKYDLWYRSRMLTPQELNSYLLAFANNSFGKRKIRVVEATAEDNLDPSIKLVQIDPKTDVTRDYYSLRLVLTTRSAVFSYNSTDDDHRE